VHEALCRSDCPAERFDDRILRALLPFALHGLARTVDGFLGVLLHSSLEIDHGAEAFRLAAASLGPTALIVADWTAAGLVAWAALALPTARAQGLGFGAALGETGAFTPFTSGNDTALALVALAAKPALPYATT
jgi:fermentation-respiration switch protein FrsA (DUF1100 family)